VWIGAGDASGQVFYSMVDGVEIAVQGTALGLRCRRNGGHSRPGLTMRDPHRDSAVSRRLSPGLRRRFGHADSVNRTFVSGSPSSRPRASGDVIRVGATVLSIEFGQTAARTSVATVVRDRRPD
jgi:hypothetical protein